MEEQEIDSQGNQTGVEREKSDNYSPEEIKQPFDPDQIEVITRNPTIDLLISRIENKAIDLQPEFQRKSGIWNKERKSRLIESLLLRIPLPTLYAAENEYEEWSIVDGIQRLTTITQFIRPDLINERALRLENLEYLGNNYNGCLYEELPVKLQRRLRETELVLHIIRNGTPEAVKFNIFARINTGGIPLTAQELRNALIGGPVRSRLLKLAQSKAFLSATDNSIRDDRMADREMVLRAWAFANCEPEKYNEPEFDEFLRKAMRNCNKIDDSKWNIFVHEFEKSMNAARAIYGQYAFRKVHDLNASRSPINKALFEAISVNLMRLSDSEIQKMISRSEIVLKDLQVAMNENSEFLSSISASTDDPKKIRRRFQVINSINSGVIND